MFERFTDRARRVLVLAQNEARELGHEFIGTEHLLLGLIDEGEGLAAQALHSLGVSLEAVRAEVEEAVPRSRPKLAGEDDARVPFTPRAKKVLELSFREALQLGHNYIGTEHMLLGLIREGQGVAAQSLKSLGVELSSVRSTVITLLHGFEPANEPIGPRGRFRREGSSPRRHNPRRVIAGPDGELVADGVSLRVVGFNVYDDSFEVFWRLSGIPRPVAELLAETPFGVSAFSPRAPTNLGGPAYFVVTDAHGTNYQQTGTTIEVARDGTVAGASSLQPELSKYCTALVLEWQGQRLSCDC